jgi:hypothetical protein
MKNLGLEIESSRKSKIGVCWTGETINTAMFTSSIRVDRTHDAKVGAIDVIDDGARGIDMQLGGKSWIIVHVLPTLQPTVIDRAGSKPFEPTCGSTDSAATIERGVRKFIIHVRLIKEQNKNVKNKTRTVF